MPGITKNRRPVSERRAKRAFVDASTTVAIRFDAIVDRKRTRKESPRELLEALQVQHKAMIDWLEAMSRERKRRPVAKGRGT